METTHFGIPVFDLTSNQPAPDRFVGNNAKQVMVLLRQDDYAANRQLLVKILGAIKFDLQNDTVLLPMEDGEKIAFRDIDFPVNFLILFGIGPGDVGLSVTAKRRLIKLENLTVIRAPALQVVASNTEEKRKLWEILKSTFIQ